MLRRLLSLFKGGDAKVSQPDGEVCDTCRELGSPNPGPAAFTEKMLGETRRYCEGHYPAW